MTRFDPIEGEDYGVCVTCGRALVTRAEADSHRKETQPAGGRSHTTRTLNPTREERIQRFEDGVVDDAISDALDDLQNVVDGHRVTDIEMRHALSWHSDFSGAWVADGDQA